MSEEHRFSMSRLLFMWHGLDTEQREYLLAKIGKPNGPNSWIVTSDNDTSPDNEGGA